MTLRVLFLGNSESVFSNRHFRALLGTPCDLVGVVDTPLSKRGSTNPLPEGLTAFVEVSRQRHVPVFEPSSPNHPEFVTQVSELKPDLLLAVGYTNILKGEILSISPIIAVNFHASLLPAYRGKHPVFWALRNNERWAGLTVHEMDTGIDTGDILYQVRVPTRRDDTVSALYDRIMDQSVNLVSRLIEDVSVGRVCRTPQLEEGASYYSSVTDEDFRLDWSRETEKVCRWITITPGRCYHEFVGQRIFFLDARLTDIENVASPGEVTHIGKDSFTIAVGLGAVRIYRARLEQGPELSMPQVCRKLGLKPGHALT